MIEAFGCAAKPGTLGPLGLMSSYWRPLKPSISPVVFHIPIDSQKPAAQASHIDPLGQPEKLRGLPGWAFLGTIVGVVSRTTKGCNYPFPAGRWRDSLISS